MARVTLTAFVMLASIFPALARHRLQLRPQQQPYRHPKSSKCIRNPVADEDAEEFVVVAFPRRTNLSGWTLSDDENAVELPNAAVSGRVAFSTAPNLTENLTSLRALSIEGLWLANEAILADSDHEQCRSNPSPC